MCEVITYSLKEQKDTSEGYYLAIDQFAGEVSSHILYEMHDLLEAFCCFVKQSGNETLRTKKEYGIELLMIGIFFREYIEKASDLGSMEQKLVTAIAAHRDKGRFQKYICDFIKGKFSIHVLIKKERAKVFFSAAAESPDYLKQYIKLVKWLEAVGDYKQEVKRLKVWIDFYLGQPTEKINKWFKKIADCTQWFEKTSMDTIGSYTKGVDNYLKEGLTFHKGKEDLLLCSRKRLEYHLNMVGSEIMNQALRKSFLSTEKKIIFLPRCMCKRGKKACCAVYGSKGYVCQHCEQTCSVSLLTKQGREKDFSVYIIPHESDFYYKQTYENEKTGIVGIACVLNLLSGGYKAIDMGFIPQCVVLDGCGCKSHWHRTGIVTKINYLQLSKIIGKNL